MLITRELLSMKQRLHYYSLAMVLSACLISPLPAQSENIDYRGEGEISVRVTPGEPTQVRFPDTISGGFRKKTSSLSLDRKESDLILFSNESITEEGEALIVRLEDGRSYPIRVRRANDSFPRQPQLQIFDRRTSMLSEEDDDTPEYARSGFSKKDPATVAGLMRELVLVAEYGKEKIPGYRMTDRYKGEAVLDDGTLRATVDKIFVGPNLWGYVIDASNELDVSQRLNPATFRLDGTRAISMTNWELTAKPLNIEQQIAGKHETKVYVITRPKK